MSTVLGAAAGAVWDAIKKSSKEGKDKGQGSGPTPSDRPAETKPTSSTTSSCKAAIAALQSSSSDAQWNECFQDAFNLLFTGTEARSVHAALVDQAKAKRSGLRAQNQSERSQAEMAHVKATDARRSAEREWLSAAQPLGDAVVDFKGVIEEHVLASVLNKIADLDANDKVARAPGVDKDPEGWATVHAYDVKRPVIKELQRILRDRGARSSAVGA